MPVDPLDRGRLHDLMERERQTFRDAHPASKTLFEHAKSSLLYGVPMNWMVRWPGDHPVFVDHAEGASFVDVDGNEYVDFCLGDTGGMAGHGPKVVVDAIADRAAKGITLMLPTEDSIWVGEEMQRRFGMHLWQFCLTATDANRFVIRWLRQITDRTKIVVHNWNYHGSVDETYGELDQAGALVLREGTIGQAVPIEETTRVVEINNLGALEAALAHGDVAACLFEPALTNIGIVLPEPGYHEGVRDLCTKYGTYLIIDETHTISAGPGGATKAWGLQPDVVTIGKTLGAGIPSAAFGMTQEVADRITDRTDWRHSDVGGVGGTLAGNALSLAAMHATLANVLTDDAFERMIALGERFEAGVQAVIESRQLPFHVTRLGCRVEYLFRPDVARNGAEAAAGQDEELDAFIHLYTLNRGILITPFHNMALMSPATTSEDVNRHTEVFSQAADELRSGG
ncbi:MAG: aspartate aminotransferase family protein [Actinomycetota bacterium]|nr:aspartate aminotransferase family protein [Actinomycetota bacterium]